ncbi:MAG: polysaccharide deacetylase family protein, partial [Thermomicrobiales bacterium]
MSDRRSLERWPAGHRAALCLTVNVDGVHGGIGQPALDGLYDQAGMIRLLDVLGDAGVSATFCWVGRVAEEEPALLRRTVDEGHELAMHSWDHRGYAEMGEQAQRQDLERTREALMLIGGVEPVGHRTPGRSHDASTHRIAQELGLLWVMDEPGGDLPSLVRADQAERPLVNLPANRWLDDRFWAGDNLLTPQLAYEALREELDVLRGEGKAMFLTLHPSVSGRPGASRSISRLLDYA